MDRKFALEACVLTLSLLWAESEGHGRLLVPPARSTMWREGFKTPIEYTDNGNNCGGTSNQWTENNGLCGFCGDAYQINPPRPLEHGGKFGTGTIARIYEQGQVIVIHIEVTAPHMGFFEFRICPLDDLEHETQECFDSYQLTLTDGKARYMPGNEQRVHKMAAILPPDLVCHQCVLQWKWHTGNSWGEDESGSGIGKGPQEEFYGCADIQIVGEGEVPDVTIPTTKMPTTTTPPPAPDYKCFFTMTEVQGYDLAMYSHFLDELCICVCDLNTGRCDNNLCECTVGGCRRWGAIGNFTDMDTANSTHFWCHTNCMNGFCPPDKCECILSPANLLTASSGLVILLLTVAMIHGMSDRMLRLVF